ncbi:hypothetical protein EJ03DRAFT_89324 [Teratosphaeria nubilosa]|uniref:Extracellular membrane protein CFEM domain-containing protein n=1 Tax=Teratosphaeria nubilosa TaxID=161662 RepID=A0A6G1LAH9_9PEZI|nr:hypothetical protein EJ03DRAFT_89324 [Teratosphaeria nubilosa]
MQSLLLVSLALFSLLFGASEACDDYSACQCYVQLTGQLDYEASRKACEKWGAGTHWEPFTEAKGFVRITLFSDDSSAQCREADDRWNTV